MSSECDGECFPLSVAKCHMRGAGSEELFAYNLGLATGQGGIDRLSPRLFDFRCID
jgi:hypothetical protein